MIDHGTLPAISTATLPAKYEAAKLALKECDKVDECKDWADKAAALASYAKQSKDDALVKTAFRIHARAVRRCGELLGEIEKAKPGPKELSVLEGTQLSGREEAATEAGMSKKQMVTSLRVAKVPEDQFEQQVESDNPPTVTALAEQGRKQRNAMPWEKAGLTESAWRTGMHFWPAVEQFAELLSETNLNDAVAGIASRKVESIPQWLEQISRLTKDLRSSLDGQSSDPVEELKTIWRTMTRPQQEMFFNWTMDRQNWAES